MSLPRPHTWALLFACLALLGSAKASEDSAATRVQALYEDGDYAGAVRTAETITQPTPDALLYHGLALARLEHLDDARRILEQGRKASPQDKRFLLELAGVAYRQKHLAEARSFLRKALKLDPADEYANDFLGSLYLLDRNTAAALKYWNRVDKPLIQEVTVLPPPDLDTVLRERAVAISGGQIFTLKRLRTTEANLDRLGIFASHRFELAPRADERFDVTLRLAPNTSPLKGWVGRLLPVARDLPYQMLHFDKRNIADRAINFNSLWRWDTNKRRIDLELAGPIRRKPRLRYHFGVDARDENWISAGSTETDEANDLKLRKATLGGDFQIAFSEKTTWFTGASITKRGFQNDDGSAIFADGWSLEEQNELTHWLLDLPERHFQIKSAAKLRTGRVFSDAPSRYAIVEGDLSAAWRPPAQAGPWQAHARLRGGKTFGDSPFDEFFQLGMERDNDLWLRGHVGTRDGKKGNAPLGTDYALVQTDFDRIVGKWAFLQLRTGPFFDAGRVSGPATRFDSGGWLLDTGIQTKVVVGGGLTWSVVYGRDLRGGHGVFYTAVQY